MATCFYASVVVFLLNLITSTQGYKELEVFTSAYKHFDYHFERFWQGQVWHGHGQLWAWFQNKAAKLRYEGEVWNQQFGKIDITTIIDSESEQLHVTFHFRDLDESQCVTYPFAPRNNVQQQIAKLMERDRCEINELKRFEEDRSEDLKNNHRLELECPGTAKYEFKFSPEGDLQSVDMLHHGAVSKSLILYGSTYSDTLPAGEEARFTPAASCQLYSKVDDPLARLKLTIGQLRTPAQKSSVLSDMLMQVSKQHIERMTQTGVYNDPVMHMRQLISLTSFQLPGDIVVLMSEPQPPDLGGAATALHFEYTAASYNAAGRVQHSSGQVWLNMTDRAFRVSVLHNQIQM
jgi:hypothetical protein